MDKRKDSAVRLQLRRRAAWAAGGSRRVLEGQARQPREEGRVEGARSSSAPRSGRAPLAAHATRPLAAQAGMPLPRGWQAGHGGGGGGGGGRGRGVVAMLWRPLMLRAGAAG